MDIVEKLWDAVCYNRKTIADHPVYKRATMVSAWSDDLMDAAAEINRLRAGGCARDQGTTQFCAEAVALQKENERLREALFAIVCNTEPAAIKHRDYDHLANAIYVWASAALGEDK